MVGHDWGAVLAWHLSLHRPDRVKGVIAMSVPYYQRNPDAKVIESFRRIFGDGFYICQFQVPALVLASCRFRESQLKLLFWMWFEYRRLEEQRKHLPDTII